MMLCGYLTLVHSVLYGSDRIDQYCSVAVCLSVVAVKPCQTVTDCAKVR